jgi:hypothetical protein
MNESLPSVISTSQLSLEITQARQYLTKMEKPSTLVPSILTTLLLASKGAKQASK